ncbi:MAG TPA: hypothetical protein VHM64_00515, partial [Candidatus Binatia bacterium]|nr:hypothetical protein [Candidatus Binatia bacterium]
FLLVAQIFRRKPLIYSRQVAKFEIVIFFSFAPCVPSTFIPDSASVLMRRRGANLSQRSQ